MPKIRIKSQEDWEDVGEDTLRDKFKTSIKRSAEAYLSCCDEPDITDTKKAKRKKTGGKRGNIVGLSKHLSRKYSEPGFWRKCYADPLLAGYDHDARAAICARAHYLVTGIWPGHHGGANPYGPEYEKEFKPRNPTTKGGPGSGNHDHAGRPGKVGGSAPQGDKPRSAPPDKKKTDISQVKPAVDLGYPDRTGRFNKEEWASMPVGDRIGKWSSLGTDEQDALADAGHSIKAIQDKRASVFGERPNSGDIEKDVHDRIAQFGDYVPVDSSKKIETTLMELDAMLEASKADEKTRHDLVMEATDVLMIQENESLSRQLGDHGINHIKGNIDVAKEILKQVPAADSPQQIAEVYLSCIFHDTGYMTEPSQMFLDGGHPRWSAEHYDANVRKMVEDTLGNRSAGRISHIISTHAGTDMDWQNDPVASAVRVADNLSLFRNEKLPGLFRYLPQNIGVLEDMATKKISEGDAQRQMISNIKKSKLSQPVKRALIRAAREVGSKTPKMTLGMLGGNIDSFEWKSGHLKVYLRRNREADRLQKLLELGQRQFGKFAESYGIDPKEFATNGRFEAKDRRTNEVLLEAQIVGEKDFVSLRQEIKGSIMFEHKKQNLKSRT